MNRHTWHSLKTKGGRSSDDNVGVMRDLADPLLHQCWFGWPLELGLHSNIFPFSRARGEGVEGGGTQARVEWEWLWLGHPSSWGSKP